MTSTIKVDTISENTSANGVTIDGLTIKDGGITATTGAIVFNEASADLDFRVESNGQANMLFVDGGNNRVHVNGTTGTRELNVSGDNTRLLLYSTNNSTGAGQLQFGDDGNEQIGRIMYEHDDNNMTFHTNATQFMELSSTGKITLTGGTATSTDDLTTGGLHFHDASTSAGNIMPITFTPSATANRARAGIGFISQAADGSAGFAADIAFYTRSAADGTTLGTDDEALRIDSNHEIASNGETAPDVSSGGLCLNQGPQDTKILSLKSSDIAHGMTGIAETDTYAYMAKGSGTAGGLQLDALAEGTDAFTMHAYQTTTNTAKSTSADAAIMFKARKKDSASAGSLSDSNANIMAIADHNTRRFLFDIEGDFHADSSSTTFDAYDDAQLVRAYDLSHGRGVIDSKFDEYVKYKHEDLAEAGLVGREDDGTPNHFINVTGFQRLHNGAIWQQYEKHQKLAEAVYEMAKETLGADKADAILKKHDIKLLN